MAVRVGATAGRVHCNEQCAPLRCSHYCEHSERSDATSTTFSLNCFVLHRRSSLAPKDGRAFFFERLNAFFIIGTVVHFTPHTLNALERLGGPLA